MTTWTDRSLGGGGTIQNPNWIVDLTDDPSPTSDDLIITVNDPSGSPANKKVAIGNLFRNIPDGSVAAPAIARGAQQDVGLLYQGNTLVIQNLQTDYSLPLMIKGASGYSSIGFLDGVSTNVWSVFDATGAFTTRRDIAITGDFSATYDPATGINTINNYGIVKLPESAMVLVVADVWGPCVSVATQDHADSLHFSGRLQGQGQLGSIPNFQIDRFGNIDIFDTTTLGTENLTEGNFATHVNWDTTGDFNDTAGNAKYTHNTGAGTLTQVSADLAIALKGNRWYKLVYTVSGVVGSPTAIIPATVARVVKGEVYGDRTKLRLDSFGTGAANHIIMFQTIAAPTDFIINGASTVALESFTLDNLSLKEIQDGDINICGKLYLSSFQTTTGAAAGTLTNAPTVGDPEGYLKVVIDGAEKAIPYWDVP